MSSECMKVKNSIDGQEDYPMTYNNAALHFAKLTFHARSRVLPRDIVNQYECIVYDVCECGWS